MYNPKDTPSQAEVVDAIWYLAAYSDVATAGLDPYVHYRLHGRAEGRIPSPGTSNQLGERLWRGFSSVATLQLHEATNGKQSLNGAHATRQLAVWHASQPEGHIPATVLEGLLTAYRVRRLPGLAAGLLCVEGLLQQGHTREAGQLLELMLDKHGMLPDLCLAAANINIAASPSAAQQVLPWLNRIYAAAGLAPLSCAVPSRPLYLPHLECHTSRQLANGPLLSVIMPVFNGGQPLHYAIQSVLAQTWRNLQLIVVDDCSTDDTFAQLNEIAARDHRVILLRLKSNQGAYAARNAGLQVAAGQFVTTHDSDDWSHPQKFELLIKTLLGKPSLAAAMCHWVRCTDKLYFKRWRMEDGLIHASVSTLMFRREIVQTLGRWDETRVAADTEYYERIMAAYGADAVAQILPQIPLVFAREEPGSLTNAVDTHRRTEYFGLRKEYLALARSWHRNAKSAADLYLDPQTKERAFPAPRPILRHNGETPFFDLVLIGDLGDDAAVFEHTYDLVQQARSQGKRLALFHWPQYIRQPLSETSQAWYDMALRNEVAILVSNESVRTDTLAFLDATILRFKIDGVPKVHFRQCLTLKPDEAAFKLLGTNATTKVVATTPRLDLIPPTPADIQRIQQTGLFDAAWYLAMYPDVRRAGINALHHYLVHGAKEGREPNAYFSTPHYLTTSPHVAQSRLSPLQHYLQIGFHAGHSASHPTLPGQRPYAAGNTTILFCAHAAGLQLFGAERSALDVLEGFAALQYNVVVCTPPSQNGEYLAALQALACEVLTISCPLWVADAEPFAGVVAQFEEAAQRFKVDAVHVNTIMLREPLAAARKLGIPAVVHVRESLQHDAQTRAAIGLNAQDIHAAVLRYADHIVANSAFTAQCFAKPGATHLVHNTINLQALDMPNPVAGLVKVGLISSNQPKKGLEDLVEVARSLQDQGAAMELLLIGPENEHIAALRHQQAQGLLPANLCFAGYAQTPLAALIQVNIVVNLSHFEESFGRTVLEAMAARRPVVAYQWGALPELVEHGVNGFLAPYRNTQAVAQRLLWLSQNPKVLVQMGEAGRKIALQRYGQEKMAGQLRAAYASILQFATDRRPTISV